MRTSVTEIMSSCSILAYQSNPSSSVCVCVQLIIQMHMTFLTERAPNPISAAASSARHSCKPRTLSAKGYMLQTVKQSSRPHSLYRASAYTPYVHPELRRLNPKTLIPHTARPQTPNSSNPTVVIYPINRSSSIVYYSKYSDPYRRSPNSGLAFCLGEAFGDEPSALQEVFEVDGSSLPLSLTLNRLWFRG